RPAGSAATRSTAESVWWWAAADESFPDADRIAFWRRTDVITFRGGPDFLTVRYEPDTTAKSFRRRKYSTGKPTEVINGLLDTSVPSRPPCGKYRSEQGAAKYHQSPDAGRTECRVDGSRRLEGPGRRDLGGGRAGLFGGCRCRGSRTR